MPGVITNNQGAGPQFPTQFNPYDKTQWRWDVGRTDSPDSSAISTGEATWTKYGFLFDSSKLLAATAYFLGYSYVDPDTLTLKRSVPAFSPELPWLLCTQFAPVGVRYTGDQDYGWSDFPGSLPLPGYEYYRCAVTFSAVDYRAIPDEDMDGRAEWFRFFSIVPNDQTELINVDGGQYVYRSSVPEDTFATAAGGPVPKPIYTVKGPNWRVHANRTGFVATWYDVAEDYICDAETTPGEPVALVRAKGCVNKTDFLGRPPGTFLLDTYKITKKPAVIATLESDSQKYILKVEMYFKFTDPSRGDPDETKRGWLLVPGPVGNNSAKWYYAWNYNAQVPGHMDQSVGLYDEFDMNYIFSHWSEVP